MYIHKEINQYIYIYIHVCVYANISLYVTVYVYVCTSYVFTAGRPTCKMVLVNLKNRSFVDPNGPSTYIYSPYIDANTRIK